MIDRARVATGRVRVARFGRKRGGPLRAVAATAACVALSASLSCASLLRGGGNDSAYLATSPAAFLTGFERAVSNRRWDAALLYLDPAYVAEQHDDMLEGRTDQFFVELLGLHAVCKNTSRTLCLSRVRSLRRERTPGPAAEAGVPVRFRLEVQGSERPLYPELHLKLGPTPRKFSLFGAVG